MTEIRRNTLAMTPWSPFGDRAWRHKKLATGQGLFETPRIVSNQAKSRCEHRAEKEAEWQAKDRSGHRSLPAPCSAACELSNRRRIVMDGPRTAVAAFVAARQTCALITYGRNRSRAAVALAAVPGSSPKGEVLMDEASRAMGDWMRAAAGVTATDDIEDESTSGEAQPRDEFGRFAGPPRVDLDQGARGREPARAGSSESMNDRIREVARNRHV